MNIFPMKAKAAKDKFEKLMRDDNYIAQEKIDGVRALVQIGEGMVKVTTRGASVDAPGIPLDITHRIPYLTDWKPDEKLWNCIFDSEITIDGLDSAQTAGVVSYKSTVDIPEGLRFNVFDIIIFDNKAAFKLNQGYRIQLLDMKHIYFPQFMETLPISQGTDEKFRLLDDVFAQGKEGIMLKNKAALYYPDKRPTNTWYKVKKVDSVDVKIVGSAPPEKFYRDPNTCKVDESRTTKLYDRGWFGALIYELEDGTQGTVSGFTDAERDFLSDEGWSIRPQFVGRYMELKFMEKTREGRLRHPRFIRLREEVEK